MSTFEKLKNKFIKKPTPKDFTWDELIRLMAGLNYEVVEGKGSHKAFFCASTKHYIRGIPKPHPGNEMKRCYLESIRDDLIANGVIQDE